METLTKIIGGAILVAGAVFLVILLGTFMGGVAGWTVGLVFVDTMSALKNALGLTVTNFELGAMLGFVGGFFRATVSNS